MDDRFSSYSELLSKQKMVTLEQKRVQNMLITVYKALSGMAPVYISSMIGERTATRAYHLRGERKLKVPRA